MDEREKTKLRLFISAIKYVPNNVAYYEKFVLDDLSTTEMRTAIAFVTRVVNNTSVLLKPKDVAAFRLAVFNAVSDLHPKDPSEEIAREIMLKIFNGVK